MNGVDLYKATLPILNYWDKQIKEKELVVSLEEFADIVLLKCPADTEVTVDMLFNIAEDIIADTRGVQDVLVLDSLAAMGRIENQKEIANALKTGEPIPFRQAAQTITELKRSTDAVARLVEFLTWVRDTYAEDSDSEAYGLLSNVITEKASLSTGAIKLLKLATSHTLNFSGNTASSFGTCSRASPPNGLPVVSSSPSTHKSFRNRSFFA
jgi:hypothetical protein